ncbi:MAG: hypothetical protein LUC41_04565 [Clostridiales bacterium]|nr:hypothetical protein [Clostridiales bacterium]
MPKSKVSSDELEELAELYNKEGKRAVKDLLTDQYGILSPDSVIRRMKNAAGLKYDAAVDRFFVKEDASADNVFMSIEELCAAPAQGIGPAKREMEDQTAAMENLIHALIGERLLELSKYVILSSLSRTVVIDRTALESNGYRVEIH